MKQENSRLSIFFNGWLLGFIGLIGLINSAHAGFNDGQGREWRLAFVGGATWSQIAQACPQDGATPCAGAVGSRDLSGWTWATDAQLLPVLGAFAPDILSSTTYSVAGPQYFTAAGSFVGVFGATAASRGCPTYQPCWNFQESIGVTASKASIGAPIQGGAHQDIESGMGYFNLMPAFNGNDNTTLWIGVWQNRPTGLGTDAIYANDDAGVSPSPYGGVAVNVLANDWLSGARATPDSVNIANIWNLSSGLSLSADGSVNVAPGTARGAYTFSYEICANANPANCDSANVSVTVNSYAIQAINDSAYASFAAGTTGAVNVLANDKLGGFAANTSVVSLVQLSSSHPGIALDLNTGAVNVAAGTSNGPHSLAYRICERANPANCARATVTLMAYSIDAVNDSWRLSSKNGATSPSVLANDWFNGARASTANVRISLLSPLIYGVGFNSATGVFTIAPKTSSGDYSILYRICEIASPDNCDTATVLLQLSGKY